MGAQPSGWPPDIARRRIVEKTDGGQLAEAPRQLRVQRARCQRRHHDVGCSPAELLRDLEGDGLGALGVEGPQVDVQEGPALELVGELQAEPVDLVIGALDAHERRAQRAGLRHLGRFQVGRHEDDGTQPPGRGGGRHGGREVAGGGAGEGVEPPLRRAGGRHGHDAVLERERRVAGVVLDPEPLEAQACRETGRRHEWRVAHPQATGRTGSRAAGARRSATGRARGHRAASRLRRERSPARS